MKSLFLTKIRQQNPLVHNITNIVAANLSANGLLALGASPLMSAAIEEIEEVVNLSQALVINIGTLMGKDVETMCLAGKTANRLGIPVVLDPVGIGAVNYRLDVVKRLLSEFRVTLIRGNAGEIATLAGIEWNAKGVDAGPGAVEMEAIATQVAQKYHTIVAISGKIDVISNGEQYAKVANGTPMFPKMTASGCLLSAICGAFLAVATPEEYFSATIEAFVAYTVAGEQAAQSLTPTRLGTFNCRLLDNLCALSPDVLQQYARVTNS